MFAGVYLTDYFGTHRIKKDIPFIRSQFINFPLQFLNVSRGIFDSLIIFQQMIKIRRYLHYKESRLCLQNMGMQRILIELEYYGRMENKSRYIHIKRYYQNVCLCGLYMCVSASANIVFGALMKRGVHVLPSLNKTHPITFLCDVTALHTFFVKISTTFQAVPVNTGMIFYGRSQMKYITFKLYQSASSQSNSGALPANIYSMQFFFGKNMKT